MKFSILILILLINSLISLGQNTINDYSLPKSFYKTKLWIDADMLREKKTRFYSDDSAVITMPSGAIPRQLEFSDYLKIIKYQADYKSFLIAAHFAIRNYTKAFPYLIAFLTDPTTVGVIDYIDSLAFDENINSKIIPKNLHTVAGRASFILNELTGEKFAIIVPETTIEELNEAEKHWICWIKRLPQTAQD